MTDRAKELFFEYSGKHCQMANDGVYDEYKSYNISKAQEDQWLEEIRREQVLNNASDSAATRILFAKRCSIAKRLKDSDMLSELLNMLFSEEVLADDPLSKLYMYETLGDTLRYFKRYCSVSDYLMILKDLVQQISDTANNFDIKKRAEGIIQYLNTL